MPRINGGTPRTKATGNPKYGPPAINETAVMTAPNTKYMGMKSEFRPWLNHQMANSAKFFLFSMIRIASNARLFYRSVPDQPDQYLLL